MQQKLGLGIFAAALLLGAAQAGSPEQTRPATITPFDMACRRLGIPNAVSPGEQVDKNGITTLYCQGGMHFVANWVEYP